MQRKEYRGYGANISLNDHANIYVNEHEARCGEPATSNRVDRLDCKFKN
jgi:hypothetical protein